MASSSLNLVVLMAMMVAAMQLHGTVAQTRHVVGDAIGWTIPLGGAATYTTWASQQNFTVGDMLFFNFTNGVHDVAEVSAAAYDPCTATNPISLATTGPATLPLTTAGTHYYICTFTSHCQIGQKLTINVSAASTTMPPSSTPAPPPTTMPPPNTTLTPPPTTMPPSSTPAPPPTTMPPSSTPSPPPTTTLTPPPTTPMTPTTPTEANPPTSSPNSSPTSPPPTTTTMTPPPPNSGSPSFTAIVPGALLAIGLAILNA